MKNVAMALLVLLMISSPAFAVEYEVNVVQKGGNLYWAETEQMYIQTEYCFESAEAAVVLLRMDGDSGEITFKNSGGKCDVKMIYGQTELETGRYPIRVTREDDDWYGIVGKSMALNTNGCLTLVDNMQASLQMNEDGTAILSIPEADEECTVEGVYSKAQLQQK